MVGFALSSRGYRLLDWLGYDGWVWSVTGAAADAAVYYLRAVR